MESAVWGIEAPSFLHYILSNTINTVQSMEDWLCKREKPSTSQTQTLWSICTGFCLSLKGLLHVEDIKLLLTPAEGAATRAQVTTAHTFWRQRSHICSGCVDPMHCCDAACWPGDIFGKGMAFSKMMWWKRRALAACVLTLCSLDAQLGLSMGCLPHFLGKEGARGTFHEVLWHREAPDTGWGPHHAESSMSPVSSAVLESYTGKSLPGFIYKENKKKSQPRCCTMGSMEKTLPWANWVFELIFSVLFVFKIAHVQASGPGHWASWAIQPPALLRTFFWVYKKSLLKQYTTISINRKGIPLS